MQPPPESSSSSPSRSPSCSALNHVFEHGFGDFQINPYYARIINLIGINITLAVSLNLINGLAGQFSIGHAGFMAVGGYTATYLTVYHGTAIAALVGQHARPTASGASIVMIASLIAGALRRGAGRPARRHSVAAAARATTSRSSRSGSARSSACSS